MQIRIPSPEEAPLKLQYKLSHSINCYGSQIVGREKNEIQSCCRKEIITPYESGLRVIMERKHVLFIMMLGSSMVAQ